MYHCVLHVQSMSLTSAASTVLILCITMFVTKVFNLDCLYITYIMISVIIRVISVAVNIIMSARKLFRNDLNFEFSSGLSSSCSFLFKIFFLFQYWIAKSLKVVGALSKLGLISKLCNDKGRICSWVVQFHETGIPNSSIMSSKYFTVAKFIVKCISRSVLVSEPPQAARDSKRKLLSASILQLHKILQFFRMYGWPGIFIGMLLLCKLIIFL